MRNPPTNFRLHAKNIFLTYPKCNLEISEAMKQIQNIQCSSNKKFIRISQETHEDGSPHLHALIQFEGKLQLYNNRLFDLTHPNTSSIFHPNIQGAKSSSDVKKYIEKEGTYLDWGEFQIDGRSARGGLQSANEAYAQALNSETHQKAMETIKELAPRDFVLQFHNIQNNLNRIFQKPKEVYVPKFHFSQFILTDEISLWFSKTFEPQNLNESPAGPSFHIVKKDTDRPKSIIIEGSTRTGKTQWARSIGPHNYLSGTWCTFPQTTNETLITYSPLY